MLPLAFKRFSTVRLTCGGTTVTWIPEQVVMIVLLHSACALRDCVRLGLHALWLEDPSR